MNTIELLLSILRKTNGDRLLVGFFVFYLIDCFVMMVADPSIPNFQDALWLGFNIATSIGLGDYTVTTAIARMAAVLLGIYGVVIVTYIPGMIASYYMEKIRSVASQSVENNYSRLKDLKSLSSSEKQKLSAKIKEGNLKR